MAIAVIAVVMNRRNAISGIIAATMGVKRIAVTTGIGETTTMSGGTNVVAARIMIGAGAGVCLPNIATTCT